MMLPPRVPSASLFLFSFPRSLARPTAVPPPAAAAGGRVPDVDGAPTAPAACCDKNEGRAPLMIARICPSTSAVHASSEKTPVFFNPQVNSMASQCSFVRQLPALMCSLMVSNCRSRMTPLTLNFYSWSSSFRVSRGKGMVPLHALSMHTRCGTHTGRGQHWGYGM